MTWYKKLIKKYWTFNNKKKKPGRPPVSSEIKQFILKIKNDNIFMRTGKIQGELLKNGIKISQSSIRRILRDFRKQGKVKNDIKWSVFIKSHLSKLFAMDFFTVESLFNRRRYYVFLSCIWKHVKSFSLVLQICQIIFLSGINFVSFHIITMHHLILFMTEQGNLSIRIINPWG
jgi:hypothetical protein